VVNVKAVHSGTTSSFDIAVTIVGQIVATDKNKVESARLIEKDGVLGFQRTATEFEPVTNFTARVDGYVADEGDVIGYILDLKLNQGDPLDPNASKTK